MPNIVVVNDTPIYNGHGISNATHIFETWIETKTGIAHAFGVPRDSEKKSQTEPNVYTVYERDGVALDCNCTGYRYHTRCKHCGEVQKILDDRIALNALAWANELARLLDVDESTSITTRTVLRQRR